MGIPTSKLLRNLTVVDQEQYYPNYLFSLCSGPAMPRYVAPDLENYDDPDAELDEWFTTSEKDRRNQLRGPIQKIIADQNLAWAMSEALIEDLCDLVIDAYRRAAEMDQRPPYIRSDRRGGRKSQDLAFELINFWASDLLAHLGALETSDLAELTADLDLKASPIGFNYTVVRACRLVHHRAEVLVYRARRNSNESIAETCLERFRAIAAVAAYLEIALSRLRAAPDGRLTLAIHAVMEPNGKDRQALERANALREIQGSIEWALQVLIAASEASKFGGRGPIEPPAALETVANLCAFWEKHSGSEATVTIDASHGNELASPAGRFVDAMMKVIDQIYTAQFDKINQTYTTQMIAGWMRKAGEKRRTYRANKQEKAEGTNFTLSAPENLHSIDDAPIQEGGVYEPENHDSS